MTCAPILAVKAATALDTILVTPAHPVGDPTSGPGHLSHTGDQGRGEIGGRRGGTSGVAIDVEDMMSIHCLHSATTKVATRRLLRLSKGRA
jgi:hypothetical protein